MAVSLVGSYAEAGYDAITVDYSSVSGGGVQDGDVIVAHVVGHSGYDMETDCEWDDPAWEFVDVDVTGTLQQSLWTKVVDGESDATFTVVGISGQDLIIVTVYVLRGADQTTPIQVAPTFNTDGSFGDADPPDVTTTADGAMILCGGCADDNRAFVTLSTANGFTLETVLDTLLGSDMSSYGAYKAVPTAGAETSPTFTNAGGSVTWNGWALAVAAAEVPDGSGAESSPSEGSNRIGGTGAIRRSPRPVRF